MVRGTSFSRLISLGAPRARLSLVPREIRIGSKSADFRRTAIWIPTHWIYSPWRAEFDNEQRHDFLAWAELGRERRARIRIRYCLIPPSGRADGLRDRISRPKVPKISEDWSPPLGRSRAHARAVARGYGSTLAWSACKLAQRYGERVNLSATRPTEPLCER